MHINGVSFSIRTDQQTREESVCEVTSDKRSEVNGQPVRNGLRDPRFGPLNPRDICETCKERRCTGHFGHIELCVPLFNVLWIRQILQWLKCVCRNCCFILVKDLDAVKTLPKIKQLSTMASTSYQRCPRCKCVQKKYQWKKDKQQIVYDLSGDKFVYEVNDVLDHLELIPEYFVESLKMCHPKHMIMCTLPVPPTCVRQPPQMNGRKVGEDDLTYRLRKISYKNNSLRQLIASSRPQHIIEEAVIELQRLVSGYFDQSKVDTGINAGAKTQYDSLAKKLKGKEGRVRGNLMGKRVNKSARAVVTAGHLPLGKVGVPKKIAKILTKQVKVTAWNMKKLKEMMEAENSIVKFAVRPSGTKIDLSFMNRKHIDIDVGWSVERELVDGDYVLFNRQPTLHKYGLMCHEAFIMEGNTFRLNLSCTPPYNADFDGDEMNLHVLQDVQSQAEASTIMHVQNNIVSIQNNKPVMSIVQDTLIGAYLLTGDDVVVSKRDFFACVMTMEDWNGDFGEVKESYTGRDLFSMALPLVNWKGAGCEILCGRLLRGQVTKKVLGSSHQSLIHVIHNDCGPKEACNFMYRLQCVIREWLSRRGFSMSISDIVCEENKYIQEQCRSAYKDVAILEDESAINSRLNAARELVGVAVQRPLTQQNQLYCMVNSGSKGSTTNISQIMAVVGQQNLEGQRIPNTWTGRTLPHFKRGCNTPNSKGFIDSNYVKGLRPEEQWFHAVSGREGVIDTACKTAQTGYTGRKLMKSLENLVAYRDGSVRNSDGGVVQFKYGDDGFNCLHVERQSISSLDEIDINCIGSEEFIQLKEDKAYLDFIETVRDPLFAGTDQWMLPIPVDRIVHNAQTIFNVTVSDILEQDVIYNKVSELVEYVKNDLLQILLRNRLNSYRLYHQLQVTEDQLDKIIYDVKFQYDRLPVELGDTVGANAAQSIGEPATQMCLNSVEYNTDLIIRWNKDPLSQNTCIGMTIDTLLEKYKHRVEYPSPETAYLPVEKGVAEALTVDEHGNASWKTLEAVTRHPPKNKDGSNTLVKITTRSGRTVTATKAKSFLVIEEGKVVTKEGSQLKIGDEIPVLCTLPEETRSEVDLSIYLDPKQYETKGIPEKITLNSSFGFFVGAYLAEGCCTEHQIHIANNSLIYRQKAAEWPSLWGIKHYEKDRDKNGGISILIMFHCTLLSTLMSTWCNEGSWNKRVPTFAYSAPRSFIVGLLEGYLSGDGVVNKKGSITASSPSKALIEGVSLLLTRLKIPSTLGNDMVAGSLQHRLNIKIRDAQKLHSQLTLCTSMKDLEHALQKTKRQYLLKEAATLNDVFIDPVTKIEYVVSEHPYVYDLTVADTRNMVTASGLTQRDTFHHAGNSSKNVTLGIPRLLECIDCATNLTNPLTTFFVKHTEAVENLEHVQLDDIVEDYSVDVKAKDVASFHLFPDPDYIPPKKNQKQIALYLKDYDNVSAVKNVLTQHGLHCAYTEGPDPIFHVHGKKNMTVFYESTLRKATVEGVKGTSFVELTKEKSGYSVATDLTDLSKLWERGILDAKTNDIQEVVKLLGIEAGRRALIIEIRKILSYYGLYVNVRHLLVLVDWMTHSGAMVPMTRHGMKKVFASPLQRATFEEVVDVVTNAAAFEEVDSLNGVAQRIMVGAPPKIGTNVNVDVVKDVVVERKYAQPKPEQETLLSNAWAQETNPWNDEEDPWTQAAPMEGDIWANVSSGTQGVSNGTVGLFPTQTPVFPSLQPIFPAPSIPQGSGVELYRPSSPAYHPDRPLSPAWNPDRPSSPAYNPDRPDYLSYGDDAYDPEASVDALLDPLSYGVGAYDPDTANTEPDFSTNQSLPVQVDLPQSLQKKKRRKTFF